ncbi:uncharacterized protein [Dasypus novemcinctus]|uniref:uncharacterized protein n=1 Tax=Dasypus novemcinctus TaxID=9361 RepID=UPI0039C94B6A
MCTKTKTTSKWEYTVQYTMLKIGRRLGKLKASTRLGSLVWWLTILTSLLADLDEPKELEMLTLAVEPKVVRGGGRSSGGGGCRTSLGALPAPPALLHRRVPGSVGARGGWRSAAACSAPWRSDRSSCPAESLLAQTARAHEPCPAPPRGGPGRARTSPRVAAVSGGARQVVAKQWISMAKEKHSKNFTQRSSVAKTRINAPEETAS